jgi:hypothetical protein
MTDEPRAIGTVLSDARRVATRNRRRARSSDELTRLFETRVDLQGVSPVADFFVESVRWSA